MILTCLLVFISGFIYEGACVFWVHYSERGQAVITALISMLVALCQVVGIGGSIHDIRTAPFFILGFGIGTWASIVIKDKFLVKK